ISRSTVSAAAPGKLVEMDRTGCSTRGSSRTSTPSSAASPATMISALSTSASTGRRTNSAARVPPRSFLLAIDMAVPLRRRRRVGGSSAAVGAVEQGHLGALTQLQDAFGDDRVTGRQVGPHQYAVAVALDDLGHHPRGAAILVLPDIGAFGGPQDRQRIDRRELLAGEIQRHREAHARAQD